MYFPVCFIDLCSMYFYIMYSVCLIYVKLRGAQIYRNQVVKKIFIETFKKNIYRNIYRI